MRIGRQIMLWIAALALAPLFVISLAAAVAGLLKCQLSDFGPTHCALFGTDIGGLLSGALTIGWMALVTIPLLMAIASLWVLVEAFVWKRRRRKARLAARQANA